MVPQSRGHKATVLPVRASPNVSFETDGSQLGEVPS